MSFITKAKAEDFTANLENQHEKSQFTVAVFP